MKRLLIATTIYLTLASAAFASSDKSNTEFQGWVSMGSHGTLNESSNPYKNTDAASQASTDVLTLASNDSDKDYSQDRDHRSNDSDHQRKVKGARHDRKYDKDRKYDSDQDKDHSRSERDQRDHREGNDD